MNRPRLVAVACAVAAFTLAPAVASAASPDLGWSDLHDGGANQIDDGYVALADTDGNAIIGGIRTAPEGFGDILVRKLDRVAGDPVWTFIYEDPAGNDMALADMVLDHRGDIMVAGYLSSCDS